VWRSYFHELVMGSSTGSQIEGAQSSFSVFVLLKSAEASGVPLQGVEKVSNYVAAKHYKYLGLMCSPHGAPRPSTRVLLGKLFQGGGA
jgi:hypothetical protein